MLVFFLLQDDHYEKPYSDPSEILPLLYGAMAPSSTAAPAVDITPPSPTRTSSPSSGSKRPAPTTPPKSSATNAASLQVQDTPLVIKESGKTPHTSMTDPKALLRNIKLAQESKGHFVGPVTADDFLLYVPKGDKVGEYPFDEVKAKMYEKEIRDAAKKNENAMYDPFMEMMKDMLGSVLSPGKQLQITKTASNVLANFFGSDVKPDFVIHKGDLKKKDGEKFDFSSIELMIEIKPEKGLDAFVDDNNEHVEGTTEQAEASLGQLATYETCHASMQTRHVVFQVLVVGDYARLLRWDRSGTIVTRKIPLSDKNFFEFFWRFCHLEASERGWDKTITKPSEDEVKKAKAKLEAAEKEVGIEGEADFYSKMSLGKGKGSYIVHRIFSGTHSPFGRGTRGYAAYNLTTEEVVFLKSTWRVVGEGRMPEHEIYDVLHANDVKHIPTVVEYADVTGQVTKTQDAPDDWRRKKVKKTLRKFQHYIIVFAELCRKLENFQSRKQLLTAFADAADAHQQGLDLARFLHRDISAGNILITREGSGILGDWDMAKHLDDLKEGGSQPERTGTFQFLSARFVSNEYDFSPHDRKDDIESFFHTLQWIVLRFVDHGMNPCKNFDRVLEPLLEDLRKTIDSRYISAEDMLEDDKWFRERLRKAANQYTSDEPGLASTPQKYTPVQTEGAKKTTRSGINVKNSTIDYYDDPEEHVSKKQKLDG
ncbi:hypothetical protein JOM56_001551 [Amanita muscaria]